MSKASEQALSELHGKLADTLSAALETSDKAQHLLNKYEASDKDIPFDIINFLRSLREVNPTMLTVVTKFLKDNNISCDGQSDDALEDLEAQLKSKRKTKAADITYN